MNDAGVFGLELRRAREHRGLSLDQLAEVTKISGSLFAGLERGDLSRWPSGIFRRAFVRAYAQAVGLEPEETLARFLEVFPDGDDASTGVVSPPEPRPDPEESAPRLVLDVTAASHSGATGAVRVARRIGAPLVDLLLAGVPAAAVSLVFGWHWFLPIAAVIGLVGHVCAIALTGATPGTWLLLPRPPSAKRPADEETVVRRRADSDVATGPRRRPARHASPTRAVPTARTRRIQH